MFDKSDIRAAVEASAISADQAARFEAFLKARNDPDRMLDPENLRFLTNFNDVFLTIGIVILMTGLTVLSGVMSWNLFGLNALQETDGPTPELVGTIKLAVVVAALPVVAAAWLLAEYFCGRRRLLLPSMALSVAIVQAVAIVATVLIAPTNQADAERAFGDNPLNAFTTMGYVGFGAAAAAAAAIFVRFRLPFSLFLVALSVAGLFYTTVGRIDGGNLVFGGGAMLIAGLVTLAFAIWFDSRDPLRASRTSDHAFWLHMAAAPQIIFGVRGLVLGSGFAPAGAADATVMLVVLLAFALISLMLNRRALIVSGLLSFGTALWVLVDRVGGGGVNTLMLTALIVGGAIVLLGGGWRTARRFVLRPMPHQGFAGRIFPPEPA
jgi:preprotein translocase subunit SecG